LQIYVLRYFVIEEFNENATATLIFFVELLAVTIEIIKELIVEIN